MSKRSSRKVRRPLPDQLRGALVPRSPSCVSDRCRCDGPRRLERLYGATSRRELGTRRAAPRPALVCCAGRSRQRSGLRRPDATPPRRAGTCRARRDARTDRLACHCRVRTTCVCTTCMMHRAAPVLPGAARSAGGDAAAARARGRRQRQGPRGRRAALRGVRCWQERRPAPARRARRPRCHLARRADATRRRSASRLRRTSLGCSPRGSTAGDGLRLRMRP